MMTLDINQLPDPETINAARLRIRDWINHTPVVTCSSIDQMVGAELFFKCENFQKVGAFKFRGAVNAVFSLTPEVGFRGVATHSSGNHAQALALAARCHGFPSYIVMPDNAPSVKKQAVLGYGARITECEPTLAAREETLARVVSETGATFIHPYNDYRIIAGQATAACELLEKAPDLDIIITPVGGGGLLSGTALATRYFSPSVRVMAAEPAGADDAYRSLEQGRILPSVKPQTIADGLLTSLGDLTFPIIRDHVDCIVRVEEKTIVKAMRLLWERAKLVVEPSAAVALAALFEKPSIFNGLRVGLILSGGNVDLEKLPWLKDEY